MRLTIKQLMKLVVFAGVACACVIPARELSGAESVTRLGLVLAEAIAIPLVWATLSVFMLKREPQRHLIIAVLIPSSVGVALGMSVWVCFVAFFLTPSNAASPTSLLVDPMLFTVLSVVPFALWVLCASFVIRHIRRQAARAAALPHHDREGTHCEEPHLPRDNRLT